MSTRVRTLLLLSDDTARPVGRNGLLLGRDADCDVVSTDPSASRRHALVRATPHGAELIPLGRGPVLVGGSPVERHRALADGDRIELPGLTVRVKLEPSAQPESLGFALGRAGAAEVGLNHSPFLVGGDSGDDLRLSGWPACALIFHAAQGGLYVEANTAGVSHDGAALEVGEPAEVDDGDTLVLGGQTLTVHRLLHAATTVEPVPPLPTRVVAEPMPRGGRLTFTTSQGALSVYLADRRFELVMALLRPPTGRCGDFVLDDHLRGLVWPVDAVVSRQEINMLISRCRRDLVQAGLAGPRLLERAPGGGATRLAVAPAAEVSVLLGDPDPPAR